MKNVRKYKAYSLDHLYDLLQQYDDELSRYDMMEYDCMEGLSIASLVAGKQEVLDEIRFKEAKEGGFAILCVK